MGPGKARAMSLRERQEPVAVPGEQKVAQTGHEATSRTALELTSYGLTLNQARIYVFLLTYGASPARMISRSLDLHRVDVYRKVRELEELGVLEMYLDSPKRYGAVEPKNALSALLQRQEQKLQAFRQSSEETIVKLNALKDSLIQPSAYRKDILATAPSYKLVLGRKSYYSEVARLVRKANKEVLRIVSAGGLVRTFPSGLYDEYVKAHRKGLSLRMISEINPRNAPYARRLAKVVHLRHLDDVHMRFTVVDRSVAVLGARFNEDSMSLEASEDSYLILEDPKFAEAYCFLFEHVWSAARELKAPR